MSIADETAQAEQLIATLRDDYTTRGYETVPSSAFAEHLPDGFSPDLILRKGEEVIFFETRERVAARDPEVTRRIRTFIHGHPGWRLQVISLHDPEQQPAKAPGPVQEPAPHHDEHPLRAAEMAPKIALAEAELRAGDVESAVVLLWVSIEAALRDILEAEIALPDECLTARAVADTLCDRGRITGSERDAVGLARALCNRAIHGFKVDKPGEDVLQSLIALAKDLEVRAGTSE